MVRFNRSRFGPIRRTGGRFRRNRRFNFRNDDYRRPRNGLRRNFNRRLFESNRGYISHEKLDSKLDNFLTYRDPQRKNQILQEKLDNKLDRFLLRNSKDPNVLNQLRQNKMKKLDEKLDNFLKLKQDEKQENVNTSNGMNTLQLLLQRQKENAEKQAQ